MARPNKRKQHMRELAKERKRKRDLKGSDRKIIQDSEEHWWESSEVEGGVAAIGLLQRSANKNLHPSGKQRMLQEGIMHSKGLPLSMLCPLEYRNRELAGKLKGIKRVLKECGPKSGAEVSNNSQ